MLSGICCVDSKTAMSEALPTESDSPVEKLPFLEIEPNRDVSAQEWRSPYCGKWDDGCYQCERRTITGERSCYRINSKGDACKRRSVLCGAEIDYGILNKLCRIVKYRRIFLSGENTLVVHSRDIFVFWEFRDGSWHSSRDVKWGRGDWFEMILSNGAKIPINSEALRRLQPLRPYVELGEKSGNDFVECVKSW
jgi:hypothetical protein